MRRRVVITGMGAITPLGHSVAELYQSQLEGKSGVGPIHWFDARSFPTQFAAQVKDFELSRFVKNSNRWVNSGPNSQFAAAAAQQALADADLLDHSPVDRTRFGVYLGAGEGIQDFHNMISLIAHNYKTESRAMDTVGFAK